ncbi:cobalamin B12-binding domain-containing protein [Halovulum dunhuangense]|nr:cobalamin B12-binding domain-containing protein [Halovulum dunhuangense]
MLDPALILPSGRKSGQDEGLSDTMVAMVLQGREDQARSEIRALHRGGMSFEQLQLGLLAPAVKKLGALWDNDNVSFVDVTVAVGTLQRLMHFVSVELEGAPIMLANPRSICIFPEPGAIHTFGPALVAEYFEHAGWQVHYVPDADRNQLRAIVEGSDVDVLGLSLGRAEKADAAATLVAELRAVSRNRRILTVAGGPALVRDPHLMMQLGVDAVLASIDTAQIATARMVDHRRADRA